MYEFSTQLLSKLEHFPVAGKRYIQEKLSENFGKLRIVFISTLGVFDAHPRFLN